ncbi:hypothetical protein KO505_14485 [Psychrosphaera sp. F3M07]|uniref:hypothetical protein n=1 Tax=Psychrosphaera sp. F3M07 TaxID=2841560 RepID=UPI001C07FDF3|nr:hypothetical protein [Psychrosphaera sp. F3M07]MBU2919151.1 hypothetical protein [Psychrosphaera sp. F3M07]
MERNFLLPLLASLFLTACIEVKDDSDDNTTIEPAITPTVTLTGSIIDLSTNQAPASALVSYKIGSQWSDSVEANSGEYSLEGLAGNSDITILIESTSDEFMPRTISTRTYYTDEGINYQNLQPINVSPAITYSFSVLDVETKAAITDLEFTAHSVNNTAYYFQDDYESSYNQTTNTYSVTIPEYFSTPIFHADLDTDGDGGYNYQLYDNYNNSLDRLTISEANLKNAETLYLKKYIPAVTVALEPQELKLRITVLDQNLNRIEGASLSLLDKLNNVNAIYNNELGQYTMDVNILNKLRINLPSFEFDDKLYMSNFAELTLDSEDTLKVYNSSSAHYTNDREYKVDINESGIDIVMYTQELNPNADTNLSLLAYSQQVDPDDYSYKLFFSVPIELIDGEIEILQIDKLNVVKGNDSADDLTLSGSTLIEKQDKKIETTTELSLNNTMLTIRPKDPITSKEQFRLNIGEIKEKASDIKLNINQSLNFYSQEKFAETDLFDINSMVLDNNNYRVNDQYIVTNNTANVTTPDSYTSQNTYLYLPKEVNLLKEFTMKKSIIIKDGVQTATNQLYTLVRNGSLQLSKVNTISLALNENIIGYTNSINFGTTLTDGEYWRYGYIEYNMNDNTDSDVNTISFEYSYETLKGEIHTGTITLPVK